MEDDAAKMRWRWVTEKRLARNATDAIERNKQQLSLSQEALKALLLANGGAMIALFSFVGNAAAKGSPVKLDLQMLHWAYAAFVCGFVFDLLAYLMAFMSQDRAYQTCINEVFHAEASLEADQPLGNATLLDTYLNQHQRYYAAGVLLAVASMVAFAGGCGLALLAI